MGDIADDWFGINPAPPPPAPPDPRQTAGAQFGANIGTAVAQGTIGNVNQVGPYGSTTYNQTGMQTITGPDGQTYQVPRYTQTTTLSPEQQQLYNQQTQLGSQLNQAASGVAGNLGQPFDLSGLPPVQYGAGERERVEQAMFDRINPQLERDREALETRLINQGFQRGTQAFTDAMGEFGRNINDIRLGITERGLGEQQGQFGMSLADRNRAFQEYNASRSQPINEITALMSRGQVTNPNVQPYNAPQVGQTPIGDYIYNSAGLANQQWGQQMAQQNAALGGLYGLGGAGLAAGARWLSDRRLKRDIKDLGIRMLNGLKLYAYRYAWEPFERVGVMADEVLQVRPAAVTVRNGYLAVDYGAL